jgi:hypothetical protein
MLTGIEVWGSLPRGRDKQHAKRVRSPEMASQSWDEAIPEAAHFERLQARVKKVLVTKYQELITLFVLLARPLH